MDSKRKSRRKTFARAVAQVARKYVPPSSTHRWISSASCSVPVAELQLITRGGRDARVFREAEIADLMSKPPDQFESHIASIAYKLAAALGVEVPA